MLTALAVSNKKLSLLQVMRVCHRGDIMLFEAMEKENFFTSSEQAIADYILKKSTLTFRNDSSRFRNVDTDK